MSDDAKAFLLRLSWANAACIVILAGLAYVFILPNCPGEVCDYQIEQFAIGAFTMMIFGNLTAISLYFTIRLWRK